MDQLHSSSSSLFDPAKRSAVHPCQERIRALCPRADLDKHRFQEVMVGPALPNYQLAQGRVANQALNQTGKTPRLFQRPIVLGGDRMSLGPGKPGLEEQAAEMAGIVRAAPVVFENAYPQLPDFFQQRGGG